MKCPHCAVVVNLQTEATEAWEDHDSEQAGKGHSLAYGHCPACRKLIVILRKGLYELKAGSDYAYGDLDKIESEEVIFPRYLVRPVEREVPERHSKNFVEACAVLLISPKASAALSRRILQDVLREEFGIRHRNLAQEIDEFISKQDVPVYLAQAVDAVRNIGNFAAHPLKDTHTGEIVEVEPGEAEWLLDVLEALFDFAFVQPVRQEQRKNKLNQKLKALGKPPMKG